ncbi:patatin-like phospholipase family protein [Rhizobium sp. L1K21]|uniref:patatin-like phospholipase family protein n=1 Tax=Rhizobium sp. L1K21 TaxID=2954933 RepID=UPI002093790F|nr:patatin-like phospholipase family protein [Rhizobium sp. L1K21]MCO6186969.1 patatin-like phospholipase family protein [Rhizobium sp. L1K21]
MAISNALAPIEVDKGSFPRVAVAFGGGGARGLAHIHIIEALDELGIRPVAISGSSIGAIMGAGWAAGMSGAEIRDYTVATLGNRNEVVSRIWKMRPMTMKDAMNGGFRFGQFNLERILKGFLPEAIPDDFSELQIPLHITATDYYGQRGVLIDEGDLYTAIAASAALPAVFRPVSLNDRYMIDGGIYNPVPYECLMDKADVVIAIDVIGGPEGDGETMPNRIDSLFGASQLMMQSIIEAKMQFSRPHLMLKPDVHRFRVLDFLRVNEVLEASAGVKDQLKTDLDALLAFREKA